MKKLKMEFKPKWSEIEQVRENVESFLNKTGVISDMHPSILMVSNELVENAVKYGSQNPDDEINLVIGHEKGVFKIEVKSHMNEFDDYNLAELDHMIQWIRGHQNPMEAYIEKLNKVASIDINHQGSGLGLVRLSYEGRSLVDFYLDENGRICVSAEIVLE